MHTHWSQFVPNMSTEDIKLHVISRMCDRPSTNREEKHIHVCKPVVEDVFVVVSAVLIVPNFILSRRHVDHTDLKMLVLLHANKLKFVST